MVKAKKHLGQHFLKDTSISERIAESLNPDFSKLIEIGPGTGVLTKFLCEKDNFLAVELDKESYDYLLSEKILSDNQIIFGDFLKISPDELFIENTTVIGNFPYNISSQILFKVFDNRDKVSQLVGMFQKEVAVRVASKEGNKDYGILSVLLQAFYDIEYLFTVNENAFIPPPKVKSGVIKMLRNKKRNLDCDEKLFIQIVKQSFNQRRKMLRKSLKSLIKNNTDLENDIFTKRPEQLSVEEFIKLTNILSE